MRYDCGKYKWTGKSADYVGKETRAKHPNNGGSTFAVWTERRTDSDGAYACLMCYCLPLNYKAEAEPKPTAKPKRDSGRYCTKEEYAHLFGND